MPFLGEKDAGTKEANSAVLRTLAGNPASDIGPPHNERSERGRRERREDFHGLHSGVAKNSRQLFERTLVRGGRKVWKRRETTLSEPLNE